MAVAINNFASSTEDRASGAQVIDGSLVFDDGSTRYLEKTFSSAGNRQSWTWSGWVKKQKITNDRMVLFGGYSAGSDTGWIELGYDDDKFYYTQNSVAGQSTEVFRDMSGWQHVVINYNGSNIVFYSNGEQIYSVSKTGDLGINSAGTHRIGRSPSGNTRYFTGQITNSYFIDGQVLVPSNFGFTDPLTDTWRPKKATITGPNDGTVWSGGSYTGTTPNSGYGVAEAFNGVGFPGDDFGSGVQWGFFPGTATLTLGKPITLKSDSTFEIYSYHSSSSSGSITFTCSNGSVTPSLSVNASNKIGSTVVSNPFSTFGAQITAITLVSSGSDWTAIAGIAVDGVVLMDNDKTNFGPNGFYLPLDGNSPIGFDESGRGNYFTPVNLCGSVGLDKATGALPILNTNGGGSVANAGVRTDAYASNLVLALPLHGGLTNDLSNSINSTTTAKTITKNGDPSMDSASSNFYGNSLDFDASGDYLSSSSSTDFAFGTDDFTIEYWVNYDDVSTAQRGDFQTSDASGGLKTTYGSGIKISFGSTSGELAVNIGGSNVVSASDYTTGVWYHNAITRQGSTVRFFKDGVLQDTASNSSNLSSSTYLAVGGYYNTSYLMNGRLQDFRIYKGVAKYTSNFLVGSASPNILPDTPSGVATKTSLTKITEGSVSFDGTGDYLNLSYSSDFVLDGDFTIEFFVYYISGSVMVDFSRSGSYQDAWQLYNQSPTFYGYSSGGNAVMTSDTPLSRGWNHLVVTRTISNNTARMFINGVQTASSTSFSHTYGNDTSNVLSVGAQSYSGPTAYFTGHISNLRIIKGTALYTSAFTPPSAPLTNVTNTKLLCCHDPLSAVGSIVTPGNITANGDAVATTFNPFNTDVNTIRGQETTHATLNPLDQNGSASISNGNLDMGNSQSGSAWGTNRATIGAKSGKFYAEYTCTASSGGFRQTVGVVSLEVPNGTSAGSNVALNNLSDSAAYFNNGQKSLNGSTSSYGASWTAGDVVGIALDVDETSVTFFVNGVSQGVASSALADDASLTFGGGMISSNETGTWNFGQKPFKFTPPDGFQPLSGSTLRPETVVPDSDQFVDVVTWSGVDGSSRTFTDFSFKPDLVWCKVRSTTYDHVLFDSVRGLGSSKELESNTNRAEGQANTNLYGYISKFTSNGFISTSGSSSNLYFNGSGATYVAWAWKAGGSKNTFNIDDVGYASAAAAGLDGGSTNPTGASVNTKSKFGIYTFDGNSSNRTMSHGLGQQPDFMIVKKKSTGGNSWVVWHSSTANDKYLILNGTNAQDTDATLFNSHASDSSTLWTLGSNTSINETSQSSVAYLWCNVPGLQKFGKYTGNGSSDGPFVNTGFRIRILLYKRADSSNNWYIMDTERDPNNVTTQRILAESNNSEYTYSTTDLLDVNANGFKVRSSNNAINASGGTYIYMAWAEAPSFNMFGASSNAR